MSVEVTRRKARRVYHDMSTKPRARRLRAGAVAVAVSLAVLHACAESPVAPAHYGPQPNLDVSVILLDAGDTIPVYWTGSGLSPSGRFAPAPGLLLVTGTFWPGELGGRLRRVTSNALRIDDFETLGTRTSDGSLRFVQELQVDRSVDSLSIELPKVAGVQPPYSRLRVAVPFRAAGQTATVSGGELRVTITRPSGSTIPAPISRRWTLGISRGASQYARLDGTAEPPTELVIPLGTLLPGDGPFDVRLSDETQLYAPSNPSSDSTYAYSVRFISTLRWPALAAARSSR